MPSFETQPQHSDRDLPHKLPESAHYETHKLSRLRFPSDDGKLITCPHPEIVSDQETGNYNENDFVDVVTEDDTDSVRMRFDTYLAIIGVTYPRYFREIKQQRSVRGGVDQGEILKRLHQDVIDYRTAEALKLKQSYTKQEAHRTNYQEVTTHEDGQFFVKLFNDLKIDGLRAEGARTREDYLDGIDEYLVFDSDALQENESDDERSRELYIGIQRSFDDKRGEVQHDHWRTIPERSNLLEIPRVALREHLEDYGRDENGRGTSSWQKLLDLRTEEATAQGKKPKEQAMPPVYRAFGANKIQGRHVWMERVSGILGSVRGEIAGYFGHERQEEHRERLQQYLTAVDAALKQIRNDAEASSSAAA